jgi:hypothetical protein
LSRFLGLPLAVQVDSAKPRDMGSGRELLSKTPLEIGSVKAIAAAPGNKGLNKIGCEAATRARHQGTAEGGRGA